MNRLFVCLSKISFYSYILLYYTPQSGSSPLSNCVHIVTHIYFIYTAILHAAKRQFSFKQLCAYCYPYLPVTKNCLRILKHQNQECKYIQKYTAKSRKIVLFYTISQITFLVFFNSFVILRQWNYSK